MSWPTSASRCGRRSTAPSHWSSRWSRTFARRGTRKGRRHERDPHRPVDAAAAAAGFRLADRGSDRDAAARAQAVPEGQADVAMHRTKVKVVEEALDANNTI